MQARPGQARWAPSLPVICSLVCEAQTTVDPIHKLYSEHCVASAQQTPGTW